MKAIYTVLILVCPFLLSAQNQNDLDYYAKMLEINSQWRYHQADCPKETTHFDSDIDAIQAHLFLVCESLIKNTPKHLNEKQLTKRLHLIEVLYDYADKKIFPTNLYHTTRTPYFVDDFGVHCAVGYLMKQSGFTDLVATIRANENYAYIEEIKTPGVAEWAEEYGFTVDELKWIQPGYAPPSSLIAGFGSGVNGTIKKLASYGNNGLLFVGDFDTVDLEPCLNIGVYKDNQISCLGNGLEGLVNDVIVRYGQVYVLGKILHNNNFYSIAIFDGSEWEYVNIPNREGAVAKTGFFGGSFLSQHLDIVIENPDIENTEEVWSRIGTTPWYHKATVSGQINQIGVFNSSIYSDRTLVGKFDQVTIHTGIDDTIIPTNNVLFFDGVEWSGYLGNAISDTVKAFVHIGNQIIFGGTASLIESSNGVLLSRYLNGVFQPILTSNSFFNPPANMSINTLVHRWSEDHLILGGFFPSYNSFYFGNNLAALNLVTNTMGPYAILNGPVNSIVLYEGTYLFGGDFTTNLGSNPINRFGRIAPHLGIENEGQENQITIYPNPFTDVIKVQVMDVESDFRILDTHGRVVHQGTIHGESAINLSDLSSGVYMLHLTNDSGNVVKRIVKQ